MPGLGLVGESLQRKVRVATAALIITHDFVAQSDSKELHDDSGKLPLTLFDAESRPGAALTVGV